MSFNLEDLYQSVILDHNRKPRNHGAPAVFDATADGRNTLCGDALTVWVAMDGDTLSDVRFVGEGCAISRASASLMTQAVRGRSRAEAEELFERFHALVTGREAPPVEGVRGPLGQLATLAGVSRFPIRVKCASLAWHTLRAALGQIAAGGASAGARGERGDDRMSEGVLDGRLDGGAGGAPTDAAAPAVGPGYVRAARLDDVPDGGLLGVVVAGRRVCLARRGDRVSALADRCPHAEFPLSEGELLGDGTVQCAWHGARFDARTGQVVQGPAQGASCPAVQTYDVLLHGDDVHVRLS
jgi:nitrogen fixation NifU-like protein